MSAESQRQDERAEEAAAAAADESRPAEDSGPGDAPEPAADLEAETARADENWDRYLRAVAELDNVRKRASRDAEKARRFALESFARELLNVRDSLEMGLAAAASGDEAGALREGCEATLKQLAATMERFGIATVDPQGQPFDPQEHEAMTVQPSAEAAPGTVLTVYQKGYTLNGRLLRPARVVVADAPADGGDGSDGNEPAA